MFLHLSVILSTGGVYPSMHLGRHPRPPGRQLLQQTVRMLLECILVTHNVKKIKGVNYKTGDVDSMCEQDLRLLKPRDFGDNHACEPETVKLSLLPTNKVWDKVIFLHLSVILFMRGGCIPSCRGADTPLG